ncbi:LacI family DNA-binding transcriptional regulator [Pararhizobium mangrovi]|uniref:LacI family transcriptional regulator n=1 Tax=Pararhizobium mangrovi TaxID=2590452 RepID=A0A506TY38_9HYPH|nr:LacI family DNA-binding transcriptional regulator [Pararhizobium mangrovi]TPW26226.1 LacI family transcriptional regulator [Pararhizobium mangrovi]
MNDKKGKPATVADVARRARVSKATAARVLGGYGVFSEQARNTVLSAAEELGYYPNEMARSISTGRTGLIGIVVGDIENAFFSLTVRGVTDVARDRGFNVTIANSGESLSQEREMVRVLQRQRVAGLIVSPTNLHQIDHLQSVIRAGTPLVTVDRYVAGLQADSVRGDDYERMSDMVDRLTALGHRRIAYITAVEQTEDRAIDPDRVPVSTVRDRMLGFLEAASRAGIQDAASWILDGANNDAAIERHVIDLLDANPPCSAILASDSTIGARVFLSLKARGMDIPRDVSLVSWFDADWTRVTSPPVTVVDQPTYLFGKVAANLLIDRIEGRTDETSSTIIPSAMIERGTVAAPRINNT